MKIWNLARISHTPRSRLVKVSSGWEENVVRGFSPQAPPFGLKPKTTLQTVPQFGVRV